LPFFTFFCGFASFFAQKSIPEQLDDKVKQLLESEPMFSGSLSFYVTDENGNQIYDYQSKKGLSTASTMKVFTGCSFRNLREGLSIQDQNSF
jgi:D-alanyl-D-alanine carboxypeptidase/D-alanyl-D-alanine-endopeptidase (penicillin-binding protein 4)